MKAEIPHVDDHVGKLQNVGAQTQGKLTDIASAAAAAGVFDLLPPENSITTGAAQSLCHEQCRVVYRETLPPIDLQDVLPFISICIAVSITMPLCMAAW